METEFNVQKYRIEHPMDYIKAMELVMDATDPIVKNELFKTIYKITRLYVPDILYKYQGLGGDEDLNNKKIKTLLNKKIYLADVSSLNDPFDNKAYFYRNEELKKHEFLKPFDGKIFDDMSAYCKISSFTSNGINNMPMWAHYSNNHKGFCVSYNMRSQGNCVLSSCMFPVQYTEKRIDVTPIIDDQVYNVLSEMEKQMAEGKKVIMLNDLSLVFLMLYLGNIKHESWSYEKEFRCSTGATAKGVPYLEAVPYQIYIGKDCSPAYTKKLVDAAYSLNIPAYQMVFNEFDSDYNLIPDKIL